MTDTTTLAPTDAELHDLADRCTPNTETGSLNYRDFARAALAKWGAPAPASGQVVALVKQLVDALEDANADSSEVLGNYTQLYSETYRPHRLLAQQEIVKQGEEAIAAAKEYLAAPPAQEARMPLSTGQIEQGHDAADIAPTDATIGTFNDGVRFAEKHHGITAAQKETP
jgi:hypothetical protein